MVPGVQCLWRSELGTNPLELELQMVVSHNIGAGNRAQGLYESKKSS